MSLFRVHWLGTSSGLPTLERNVSCLVVEVGGHLLVLDAGEGAQILLKRGRFHLGALHAVCVTHAHGDHSFGLPGLFSTLWLLHQHQPLLVADGAVAEFLRQALHLSTGERDQVEVVLLEQEQTLRRVLEWDGGKQGEVQVFTRMLDHRVTSHGFRVELEYRVPPRIHSEEVKARGLRPGSAWGKLAAGENVQAPDGTWILASQVCTPAHIERRSFAYLTDTKYCEGSVDLARGADLISHESTFLPRDQARADRLGHATTDDALRVLSESGASRMVMTHFSARYKREEYEAAVAPHPLSERVIFAEDGLCIDL